MGLRRECVLSLREEFAHVFQLLECCAHLGRVPLYLAHRTACATTWSRTYGETITTSTSPACRDQPEGLRLPQVGLQRPEVRKALAGSLPLVRIPAARFLRSSARCPRI